MSRFISSAVSLPTISNLTLFPMILTQCYIECQHPVQKSKWTKTAICYLIFLLIVIIEHKAGYDSSPSETFFPFHSFLFIESIFCPLALAHPFSQIFYHFCPSHFDYQVILSLDPLYCLIIYCQPGNIVLLKKSFGDLGWMSISLQVSQSFHCTQIDHPFQDQVETVRRQDLVFLVPLVFI